MNNSIIAIIGAGRVGTTTAYALMLNNLASTILLVDVDDLRCKGEVLDLEDVIPFCTTSQIKETNLSQAAQADIIIITAGAAQNPGQPRSELLTTNKKMIDSIIQGLRPINPEAIIIVVTNPVDVLTLYVQSKNILPKSQVFGSGTFLDSIRLRGFIARHLNVTPEIVNTWILGEHGDSQFAAWSLSHCDGKSLLEMPEISQSNLDNFALKTKDKVYEIVRCKGSTFYGIATCLALMVQSILMDKKMILPVSWFHPQLEVCLGWPCTIGRKGIEEMFSVHLTASEQKQLEISVQELKKMIDF
jgi:L-lactate dehydrogenase